MRIWTNKGCLHFCNRTECLLDSFCVCPPTLYRAFSQQRQTYFFLLLHFPKSTSVVHVENTLNPHSVPIFIDFFFKSIPVNVQSDVFSFCQSITKHILFNMTISKEKWEISIFARHKTVLSVYVDCVCVWMYAGLDVL